MPAFRDKSYRAAVSRGMHYRDQRSPCRFVQELLKQWPSVSSWARARKVPLSTVASWYGKRRKSIPRHWADLIASEFVDKVSGKSLVPATPETWPNGIL